jgi:hypothetical protein
MTAASADRPVWLLLAGGKVVLAGGNLPPTAEVLFWCHEGDLAWQPVAVGTWYK